MRRAWQTGDQIQMHLPMRVVAEPVQDKRPADSSLHALMMGPLLMAGLTDWDRKIVADPAAARTLHLPARNAVTIYA
ncbi:hypothetical protein WJX73_010438 [Symbiochloris irregularis]|uniref:Uncharacterized protein n=1 Tax=Symbiochloris irregularis TaxID=706552 RepID=A0AAW1PFS9_9CHLO